MYFLLELYSKSAGLTPTIGEFVQVQDCTKNFGCAKISLLTPFWVHAIIQWSTCKAAQMAEDGGPLFNVTPTRSPYETSQEEHSQNFAVPGTTLHSSLLVLPENATRADAITELSRKIPLNQYSLPTFFYRSDMLPWPLGGANEEECNAAVTDLDYSEGFPTFLRGHIFWYKLPWEPEDCFHVFERYLQQAETLGLRQMQRLALDNHLPLERVTAWADEFMWAWRARSYDLFQVAADRKKRNLRARRLEDDHYAKTTALIEAIQEKFNDPDWIGELSAKEAIEALIDLMKVQRMSVGLAANGNSAGQQFDPQSAATGSDLMSEIVRALPGQGDTQGVTGNLQTLLQDPTFAWQAQALILRVSGHNTGTSSTQAVEDN